MKKLLVSGLIAMATVSMLVGCSDVEALKGKTLSNEQFEELAKKYNLDADILENEDVQKLMKAYDIKVATKSEIKKETTEETKKVEETTKAKKEEKIDLKALANRTISKDRLAEILENRDDITFYIFSNERINVKTIDEVITILGNYKSYKLETDNNNCKIKGSSTAPLEITEAEKAAKNQ